MSLDNAWRHIKAASFCTLCFICLLFSSCSPATPELPYEEQIVIRGLLEAGQLLADVQISRTIPPLDTLTYEKIFIGDAKATITVDGKTYSMELQPRTSTQASVPYRSLYRVPNLRVEAGKTYSLEVQWKSLVARAQTRVPLTPDTDSVNVLASFVQLINGKMDTVFESSAAIRARTNEVYRVGTTLNDPASGRLVSSRGFGDAVFTTNATPTVITSNIWRLTTATLQILTNRLQSRVNIEAYDGQFYQYYQTRSRSGQIGLFSPGGPNIAWNVTGDGIGEIVGMIVVQRPAIVRIK